MSATTAPAPAFDLSATRRPSFASLVKVELRKMADTRAGMWLLITVALVTLAVNAGVLIWGNREALGFDDLLAMSGIPQSFLLPILAILLVTQEWGQRTGLATFTLTPHRGRVLAAKLVAALGFVLGALVIALAIATVLTPLTGQGFDGVTAAWILSVVAGITLGALQGFAFGALLLSSAFAIVAFFAVPMVISILTNITGKVEELGWLDFGTSSGRLFEPGAAEMTGDQWNDLITSTLIWVVLPLVVGVWRVLRTEVK